MQKFTRSWTTVLAAMLVALLAIAGCSSKTEAPKTGEGAKPTAEAPKQLAKVKLQLKWVPQAQFAGYMVAQEKGFYKDEGLDVQILPGGPDIVPEQQVANGAADFGIDWVASLLTHRDKGLPLVEVAQIFQKSGMMTVAKTKTGIKTPADFKGKKIGVWYGGNEFEFLALLDKYNLNPEKDLRVIKQGFTMDPFVADQMDGAAAMTYNEYWVAVDAGVKPEEMVVIDYNKEGVGMLEDNLFVRKEFLEKNKETAVKFVRASIKGWKYAVEHQDEATSAVLKAVAQGSTTEKHQKRMMAEVAKLVVPEGFSADKIGTIDAESFKRTADIAHKFKLLKAPADLKATYTTEIIEAALKK